MSTLVVHIPQRRRLRARSPAHASTEPPRTDFAYVVSADGLGVQSQGRCAVALLPKATNVVAVLSDADVSWHRITLPKAPAARLRAALDGVLEEALLEDTADVHLALAPQAVAGQPVWVAAVDRAWLRAELAALEAAEVFVDRVVPMAWPADPPLGHFTDSSAEDGDAGGGVVLNWAHADGVASVRLQGGLARSLVPDPAPQDTRWSASPGAVAAAEAWVGAPVAVLGSGERLLRAAQGRWNLRQFDMARRTRGGRAVTDSWRRFLSREWRPVRYGLVALLLAQLVGLNAWAWHQRGVVDAKRAEVQNLVRSSFPKASPQDIQRDPDAVLQREAQALRTLAGQPGDADLEPLLQAAAAAWPPQRPPVDNLRYEPGKLTLAAAGWSDAQIEQFRGVLRGAGLQVESSEGRLAVTRAPRAAKATS